MINKLSKLSTLMLATALSVQVSNAQYQNVTVNENTSNLEASENLPYINYKGLTDPGMAKQAWVNDNPAAYADVLNRNTLEDPAGLIGTYTVQVNDVCANAIPVTCGNTVYGNTIGATSLSSSSISGCGTSFSDDGTNSGSAWYVLIGDGTPTTINTCTAGTDYDTWLTVYTGTCGSLSCVGFNDDSGCPNFRSTYTFPTNNGQAYYIVVSGWLASEGNFELEISGSCSMSCSITLPNQPIDPLYAAAGANDPTAYYPGLSGGKVFVANATGGTAPYTYQWSTTSGTINAFANKPNKAQLNYPTQASTVMVIITDATNATCTASVAVPYIDYTCPPEPGMLWYYQLCNTQTNTPSCVHTTAAMRTLLQTGNYVFGACSNPNKTNYTMGENEYLVYPNPTTGSATLQYLSATNANAQISVVDLNGRVLLNQDIQLHEGVVEHQLDLSTLSDGFYFVQLLTENDAQVQRIQVMK